jgi:hypothetical protein
MMLFERKQFQDQSPKMSRVMKKYSIMVFILFVALNSASAKLRNGYEKDIHSVLERIKNYNHILGTDTNLSASQKRKLKNNINDLVVYQSHYELTEELLNQFKTISPGLYNRIDSIRDAKGRLTDVYVKFISREEALVMAAGVMHMAQSDEDKNACFSEYGKNSVSIKIWISSKALLVLSHELGHVNYQVPNFESYVQYYKAEYSLLFGDSNCVGHSPTDPSGRNAATFEKEYKKDFVNNLKYRKHESRSGTPMALMTEIKRKVTGGAEGKRRKAES